MNEDEFWDAIGLLNRGCGGDDVAAAEPLVAHLAALSNGELFAFDDALAERLRALDRRDVAERAFGPFRDRFFPDEFWGGAARASRAEGCYGRPRRADTSRRRALRGAHVRPDEGLGP